MKTIVTDDLAIFMPESIPFMLMVDQDEEHDHYSVPTASSAGKYFVRMCAEGTETVAGPYDEGMACLVMQTMTEDLRQEGHTRVCDVEMRIKQELQQLAENVEQEEDDT